MELHSKMSVFTRDLNQEYKQGIQAIASGKGFKILQPLKECQPIVSL